LHAAFARHTLFRSQVADLHFVSSIKALMYHILL
jgi:hypothetical protein